jgi:hypothetical protein
MSFVHYTTRVSGLNKTNQGATYKVHREFGLGRRPSGHGGLRSGCLHLHVNLKRQVLKQFPFEPSPRFPLPPKHL